MSERLNGEVVRNDKLASGIYRMTLQSDVIAKHARPGQFVNVKCGDGINALLRRPISICTADPEAGTFDIVYQLKGVGTELLSRKQPGETVDVIGPLGNPFDLRPDYKRIAVVGGGIGVFPLLYLLQQSCAAEKHAYLGFRSQSMVVLEEEFEEASDVLGIATDDGSAGHHGLVTDLLRNGLDGLNHPDTKATQSILKKSAFDVIYTCGPTHMLKGVANAAEEAGIPCQVSMEQRMGCGIGACLVCACKTRVENGEWEYSHVCKDGPVFWSREVVFDD